MQLICIFILCPLILLIHLVVLGEFFLSLLKDIFFIAFTEIEEGKRKSERNIDVREKHQLAAFSYVPRLGIKPTTWACALIGN